jgi:hypothetical protein
MSNKKEILTRIILEQLPSYSEFKKIPEEKTLMRWWITGRSSNNLRLTEEGKQAFDLAEIEFFDFPFYTDQEYKDLKNAKSNHWTGSKLTIRLKKIDCPFYIGLKTAHKKSAYIRVYDSKIATIISLYGSVLEFLESKK